MWSIGIFFALPPFQSEDVDLKMHYKLQDIAFGRLFFEHFISILFVPLYPTQFLNIR